ncbi:F0F1 ATP synthase subunit B [Blochmannia endosymbiont of Camponotus (Colobopsis) obliquus]|uniref:F0F1 ATP synthase subunit B n=1 Tax=Blochmannia endosymbiont of Camponotus (Colobopsis) obliquus TaxID=1505597 RepID=UPI00061A7159|nr:F0F1 ATP synthase subunit B [Blochmannia endosymbiont of Camponotus (Colobopsis) obliquus]AKC60189.1 ATP synthase subunit b [Blochmannia endosymbiont of Camponotus (Colobopsis) obliquus]
MNLNLTILGQIISFVLFVGFCIKYVWPPLINIIEQRQKKIADDLAYAENIKKKSDRTEKKANKYLQQAQIQAKNIINQANKYKMTLLNEAKKEAQYERTKILSQATKEIQLERSRVYEEIHHQFASLIVTSTEKIIQRSMNKDIDVDIINSVINSL